MSAQDADPVRRPRRVVPSTPEDRARVEATLAQAAERAAIVRWLRREPNVWLNRAADAIERGAHIDGGGVDD